MRFQHGVDESPTRLPISATEREASSCKTARIFRSIASIAPTAPHLWTGLALVPGRRDPPRNRGDGRPGGEELFLPRRAIPSLEQFFPISSLIWGCSPPDQAREAKAGARPNDRPASSDACPLSHGPAIAVETRAADGHVNQ